MAPVQFNGQLRPNEIFASIYNMLISQHVFADPIRDGYTELVNEFRTEGSLYGDTKLFYSTNALKTHEWLGDREATNLLDLDRPEDPKVQAINIDKFRQIRLTVDDYLSKRAWSTPDAFAKFNSVMQGWLRNTKKAYDALYVNTRVGTMKADATFTKMNRVITLPTPANNASLTEREAANRLSAQQMAAELENILDDVKDILPDYNEYGFLRSYSPDQLKVIWNVEVKNKILKIDLPSLFHDDILNKIDQTALPARFFGTVINTDGSITVDGNTENIRSLVEKDIEQPGPTPGATQIGDKWYIHVRPGDLLPTYAEYKAGEAYKQDPNVLFKIVAKDGVKYMSAFETGTDFFNPRSLTTNKYLTFGHSDVEYLYEYPLITVSKSA